MEEEYESGEEFELNDSSRDIQIVQDPKTPLFDADLLLFKAAHHNDVEAFKKAVQAGGRVSIKDINGLSPLEHAAEAGSIKIVNAYIKNHPAVFQLSRGSKKPPEFAAAQNGHGEVVAAIVHHRLGGGLANKADYLKRTYESATLLHHVCQSCSPECVNSLLEARFDPLQQDDLGQNGLMHAAKAGRKDVLEKLVPNIKQSDLSAVDIYSSSVLHIATKAGHLEVVRYLLENGASSFVNLGEKGEGTALHCAAHYNQPEIGGLLVGKGGKVDALDKSSRTPLHIAAYYNVVPMVQFLQERNAKIEALDKHQASPLILAASSDSVDALVVLVDTCKANINARTINQPKESFFAHYALHAAVHANAVNTMNKLIELMEEKGVDVEDSRGRTPFLVACERGNLNAAKTLIQHKAVVFKKDKCDFNALHLVCKSNSPDSAELVAFLLEKHFHLEDKAKVKVLGKFVPQATSFMLACRFSGKAVLNLLKVSGANTSVTQQVEYRKGKTEKYNGLDLAVISNNAEAVAYLLDDGIFKIDYASNKAEELLRKAVCNGAKNVVEILLARGVDINCADKFGKTPLHYAAQYGKNSVIKVLLDNGANPKLKDKPKGKLMRGGGVDAAQLARSSRSRVLDQSQREITARYIEKVVKQNKTERRRLPLVIGQLYDGKIKKLEAEVLRLEGLVKTIKRINEDGHSLLSTGVEKQDADSNGSLLAQRSPLSDSVGGLANTRQRVFSRRIPPEGDNSNNNNDPQHSGEYSDNTIIGQL